MKLANEVQQLPIEKWSLTKLATAGVELAERLHELKRIEEEEATRRQEYKAEHEEAIDQIENLRHAIEEQKAVVA